eukprot:gene9991-1800_t
MQPAGMFVDEASFQHMAGTVPFQVGYRTWKLGQFSHIGARKFYLAGEKAVSPAWRLPKAASKHPVRVLMHLELPYQLIDLKSQKQFNTWLLQLAARFEKLLTICSPLVRFLNQRLRELTLPEHHHQHPLRKHIWSTWTLNATSDFAVSMFMPVDPKFLPGVRPKKKYDVVYAGTINAGAKAHIVSQILPFKYLIIGDPHDGRTKAAFTSKHPEAVRHFKKASKYRDKLDLICSAKSEVVINMVTLGRINDSAKILPNAPQLKSRVFEAAFCKTVMIVLHDNRDRHFNLIEEWFIPHEHFVYCDWNNLTAVIADLKDTNRYESYYEPMAERAYQLATREYTTLRFVEKYLVATWLTDNGYDVALEAGRILVEDYAGPRGNSQRCHSAHPPYLALGYFFLCLKLQKTADTGDNQPIMLKFNLPKAAPVPNPLHPSTRQQQLWGTWWRSSCWPVHKRARPTNFFESFINEKEWDWINAFSCGNKGTAYGEDSSPMEGPSGTYCMDHYNTLAKQAIGPVGGRSFITEYAGQLGSSSVQFISETMDTDALANLGTPSEFLQGLMDQGFPVTPTIDPSILSVLKKH